MSSVLFPAFTQVQGEPERLQRGYLTMTEVTAMLAAPGLGVLAVAAPHLILTLYGTQWVGVVVPLQVFCAAGYFRALYHLGGIVVQSVGQVYRELWCQVVYAALVLGGATIGTRYGLKGVAVGVSLGILYMFVAMGHLALQVTGTSWRRYFGVQIGPIITGAVVTIVAFAVRYLLEKRHAASPTIALLVGCGAAVPWSIAVLWKLSGPGFEPLVATLPDPFIRIVERVQSWRA